MSVETQDVDVEVDLSKLIDVGLSFLPLQLTIKDILQRLARLERENTAQNDQIAQLTANMAELESANEALQSEQKELAEAVKAAAGHDEDGVGRTGMEGADAEKEHAAIWEEMGRLNELLGELQEGADRDRHTIDEIYAARKQQNTSAAAAGGSRHPSISTAAKTSVVATPSAAPRGNNTSVSVLVPPGRGESAGSGAVSQRSQEGAADASEMSVPVGDLILSKAHQALELPSESQYKAFGDSQEDSDRAGGDDGDSAAMGSRPVSGLARGRRGQSIVDGPYGPQGRPPVVGSRTSTAAQEPQPSATSPKASSVSHPSVSAIGSSATPRAGGGVSPMWAATTGGEDAGEHREPLPSSSEEVSSLRRPSMYAEKRMSSGVARRSSIRTGTASSTEVPPTAAPASVFEKLRRDGEDIAYLNRVVAEILGEMKGLHEDVDLLRTRQDSGDAAAKVAAAAALSGDEADDLLRRLGRLENEVGDVRQRCQHEDEQLRQELDDLKKQLRSARGLTDDDVEGLRRLPDLTERLRQLEERVRALEAGQEMMKEQLDNVLAIGAGGNGDAPSEVNAVQFAALQGATKGLEKQLAGLLAAQEGQPDWSEEIRRLTEALRAVEGEVREANDQLQRVQQETNRLDDVKANRSELPDDAMLAQAQRRSTGGADTAALAELALRLGRAESSIERLGEDKADRSALHKLRDELNSLRQLVELNNAQRRDGADGEAGKSSPALERMLRDLQGELSALKEAYNNRHGGGLGDADDLRERIEKLDHCKADATLVANKAERDYVENALERLMREVEQVLNATNVGLIDTLEKSLGILRDMIDGKATKQDVANLQGWMAEANAGGAGAGGAGAPDGLTGFKGFRCLGCNRPMDNMRPRTLPAPMTPFLNRNPQNHPQDNVTRTIQQQQQLQQQPALRGVAPSSAPGITASGLGASNGAPARAPVSADGAMQRGSNSEPLPRIESM